MGKNNRGKNKKISESENSDSRSVWTIKKRNEVAQLVDNLLKTASRTTTCPKEDWDLHLEIDNILQRIKDIEPGLKTSSKSREEYFPELIDWVKTNGGTVENVSIAEFPEMGFGLRAERDLTEGDVVCEVPRGVMMTVSDVEHSELQFLLASDPMLKQMGNVALALFLILESTKGDKSFWYPYIASLPRRYTTVLYFSAADMLELKGSPTLEPALKQCRNIARQYAYFSKVFRTSQDAASIGLRNAFTYKLYCWAVSTVMTRQNYLPPNEQPNGDGEVNGCGKEVNALIPLWDMCNHTDGHLSTEFVQDRSVCRACKDFKTGQQVLIFYGPRPNSDFLVHNGFVHTNNPRDAFILRLGVSKADPLHASRARLLEMLAIPASGEFRLRGGLEPVEGRLLAFLRVFSMEEAHLQHWIESGRGLDLTCVDCALETDVENKAWNFLTARLTLLLAGYRNLEKTTELSSVSPCRRLVLQQKTLEKQLLDAALEYVKQRIKT